MSAEVTSLSWKMRRAKQWQNLFLAAALLAALAAACA
jgi:hypothetical protein